MDLNVQVIVKNHLKGIRKDSHPFLNVTEQLEQEFLETIDCANKELTKNEIKKKLKRFLSIKANAERRAREKEKKKLKRKTLEDSEQCSEKSTRLKRIKEHGINPSSLGVIIDCAFDDLMTEKEISSMVSQITRCYSLNRTSPRPLNLMITSFDKRLKSLFEARFSDQHKAWNRSTFYDNDLEEKINDETLSRENIVYLTADSDNILEKLDETKTYVIGGIVDRNRHKNICKFRAEKYKITTAALPLTKYINLQQSQVLTVNHVFEILLRYLETEDWKQAILETIPQRKLAENPQC